MLFSNTKKVPQTIPLVSTLEGNVIEVVHTYKYLGILLDDFLTFKPHIDNLVKKLKLGFSFEIHLFLFGGKNAAFLF